jgi:hypothetical protein
MFIKRAKIDKLTENMITWRDMGHESYAFARDLEHSYIERAEQRGDSGAVGEIRAADDRRLTNAVANSQMYDRFATRDASVLAALASLVTAGLLEVRD